MKKTAVFLLLVLCPLALLADVPVRTEQLVFSLIAFNGRDYSPTFCAEDSDTVYLLAGADSFLSVRKTLVYLWPITGRYQTDAEALNVQLSGSLEVRALGGKLVRTLHLERYTFFNVRGEYEQNWKVAVGDDAEREYQRAQALSRAYVQSMDEYTRRSEAYQAALRRLSDRAEALKAAGRDASAMRTEMSGLAAPARPLQPQDYIVPPAPVQQAFVVNLPAGEYRVRFVNPDGSIMERSEKRLIVHQRSRTNRIGYEVIPSDKWTRPEQSTTPSSVLSISGSADLFVRPFFEDELNDLAYQKTVDNAARGNPNVSVWVRIQQVPHAVIEIRDSAGMTTRVAEQPFTVQQTQGSGLGYTIAPYDPASAQKDPDLVAFHVPIRPGTTRLTLRALDAAGAPLPGSERQIRVVTPSPLGFLLAILSVLPIVAMTVVLVLRSRSRR